MIYDLTDLLNQTCLILTKYLLFKEIKAETERHLVVKTEIKPLNHGIKTNHISMSYKDQPKRICFPGIMGQLCAVKISIVVVCYNRGGGLKGNLLL